MQKEGRHLLLILDSASAHCTQTLLINVEIDMLPPNTTSVLQPMDAGLISCLKECFRRKQGCHMFDVVGSVIDHEEKSAEDIYKVDVLQAMHWCRDAWEYVTQSTIANCWKQTGIIPEDLYELTQGIANVRLESAR
uniref:PREDICTED: similar to Tigger transposable elementderived protein 6 putative n=1 Tax=Albugo laibachii Nc14 TaxID=890382 RepID=F0WCE2_9STRA|nr:PREDICTED: similar to Tigger transposable elementderived protein 6 putative [Albugo laibachii Nc14]|eukprot:CCA18857.1 PREDICTED: similar to Tigger transposable elementderived protein 6 putative [Albugo laibachii Nc14]